MSFFKKLTKEFDSLTASLSDKKDEGQSQSQSQSHSQDQSSGGTRDYRMSTSYSQVSKLALAWGFLFPATTAL
jgi:hypothetical protein